jgi:nitrate/nitrite transporter NarK
LVCLGLGNAQKDAFDANDKPGIATFFTVMTIAEGGGRRAVSHKLRDMYLPTLKANFMVWPLVQIINFRLMPLQFQLASISQSINLTIMLILITALRIVRWYCLDRIFVSFERC